MAFASDRVDLVGTLGEPTGLTAPRYHADWIGGIVPGVLGDRRPAWFPPAARDAPVVVLVVIDGLGADVLRARAADTPHLQQMAGRAITASAPTTTVAGLTSITTGAVPAVHGLVGYRFRVGGQVLSPLRWRFAGGSSGPDPANTQPVPPFLGRRVAVVNPAEFATTGFTQAHLRGGVFHGYDDPEELPDRVRRAIDDGEGFVYAYDDRLDKAAHNEGLDSDEVTTALCSIDRIVGALVDTLPGHVAVMVTADHGHLPVDPDRVIGLEPLRPYTSHMAGDPRWRILHAATGAGPDLLANARRWFGRVAWVLTREQVVDSGLLGGRPGLDVVGRLGDVVLLARDGIALIDPGYRQEATLASMHGGLDPAEMMVPLLAARGRRSP